jgi:hypothetical protein
MRASLQVRGVVCHTFGCRFNPAMINCRATLIA